METEVPLYSRNINFSTWYKAVQIFNSNAATDAQGWQTKFSGKQTFRSLNLFIYLLDNISSIYTKAKPLMLPDSMHGCCRHRNNSPGASLDWNMFLFFWVNLPSAEDQCFYNIQPMSSWIYLSDPKNIYPCLSFLNIAMAQMVEIFPMEDRNMFISNRQYHVCWWPCDATNESISNHGIDRVHDDVIKWKTITRYWPYVRGIQRSSVNSPHKGQWRGTLMFSLICWTNRWTNHVKAGELRRHRSHYDVISMFAIFQSQQWKGWKLTE